MSALIHFPKRGYMPTIRDHAEAQCMLADDFVRSGDRDRAMRLLITASEIDPDFALPCDKVGTLHTGRKKYHKAIKWYEKALDRDKNYQKSRFNLAVVLDLQQRFHEAYDQVKVAVQLDATDAGAHYLLAQLADKLRCRPFEAFRHYVLFLKYASPTDHCRQHAEREKIRLGQYVQAKQKR